MIGESVGRIEHVRMECNCLLVYRIHRRRRGSGRGGRCSRECCCWGDVIWTREHLVGICELVWRVNGRRMIRRWVGGETVVIGCVGDTEWIFVIGRVVGDVVVLQMLLQMAETALAVEHETCEEAIADIVQDFPFKWVQMISNNQYRL